MIRPIFILLCIFIFVTGCTIEKRLYNKGFHVEWKRSAKSADSPVENEGEISGIENKAVEAEAVISEPDQNKVVSYETNEPSPVLTDSIHEFEPVLVDGSVEMPLKDTVYIDDSSDKMEPFGLASAISLAATTIAIRFMVNYPQYWIIPLGLFAIAFILSVISVIRNAIYKGYYKSNILGVFTFVMCLLVIGLFVTIALLL